MGGTVFLIDLWYRRSWRREWAATLCRVESKARALSQPLPTYCVKHVYRHGDRQRFVNLNSLITLISIHVASLKLNAIFFRVVHTEQARIALKFYKWVRKGPYSPNIQRKNIRENNVESSIEPPTAESYFSVSGPFFHSGSHIQIYHKSGNFCIKYFVWKYFTLKFFIGPA